MPVSFAWSRCGPALTADEHADMLAVGMAFHAGSRCDLRNKGVGSIGPGYLGRVHHSAMLQPDSCIFIHLTLGLKSASFFVGQFSYNVVSWFFFQLRDREHVTESRD